MRKIEDFEDGTATRAPRPVIYVRSATDDGDPLNPRVEDARGLAHLHGLDVPQEDITAEYGSGALIEGRLGLQSIMEQTERGEISHLITPRTSNLGRDYHDQYRILVALAEAGVAVVTDFGDNLPQGAHDLVSAVSSARR